MFLASVEGDDGGLEVEFCSTSSSNKSSGDLEFLYGFNGDFFWQGVDFVDSVIIDISSSFMCPYS